MTTAEWLTLAGIVVAIVAGIVLPIGGWVSRGIFSRINKNSDKIEAMERDSVETKLHNERTFATKQGMHEQTLALTKAISDVAARVDRRFDGLQDDIRSMNHRLDQHWSHERNQPPRRSGD
jgi:hypothetical protein